MADTSKIEQIAKISTFYVQGDLWFRIDYVDEGVIHVCNENTGDEHLVAFEDVNLASDTFYRLTPVDPNEEIKE